MPVDECKKNKLIATARCHPKDEAHKRVVAEGEGGYFNGTTGLPVGSMKFMETYADFMVYESQMALFNPLMLIITFVSRLT